MDTDKTIREALQQRILIIDGAMGTMIQRHKLEEKDYRGERFSARISTRRMSCCRTVFYLWKTGTTIICFWSITSCWQIS